MTIHPFDRYTVEDVSTQIRSARNLLNTMPDRKKQQAIYQIKVKGVLDEKWSDWFDGLMITPFAREYTLLTGKIRDQSALHGLLNKIRDLGLPLISVEIIDWT